MKQKARAVPLLCLLAFCLDASSLFAQRQGDQRRTSRRETRPLPDGVELHADIPYAGTDNPRQKLDLILPKKRSTDAPLPVIAYIHGGAWRAGNKNGSRRRIADYVRSGKFAGVSIAYRLSQEKIWPAQIHDCKAAIRWVRANASQHGLDGDRIAVWGASAGGHLVAMLGVSGGVDELEGKIGPHLEQKSSVHCVVDYYGPTDFLKMNDFPSRIDHDAADSPESQLVGGAIGQKQAAVRSANPITYVSQGDAIFLIAHGTKDPLVAFNQSELLHAALRKAGVSSTLITVDGGGHGFRNREIGKRVRSFLEKHLLDEKRTVKDETIKEVARREGARR